MGQLMPQSVYYYVSINHTAVTTLKLDRTPPEIAGETLLKNPIKNPWLDFTHSSLD